MTDNQTKQKVQNKKYGNRKLSQCIEKMYLDSETADVHFEVVGDDGIVERVPAHKNLLAAVSNVFKAMFYGQLKEEGDVKLTDVTAEALKEFLQFFYMREVEPTMENIAEVMHLGHKYDVARCVDVCEQFLKENLIGDNVCTGLSLALLYDHKELLKMCEGLITVNTDEVFKSTSFLECDTRALNHILRVNRFSCSETEVFEACMSWVRAKNDQDLLTKETMETHLGDLFYEIRFASMTMPEFATLANSYGSVILSNDFENIAKMIVLPEFKPENFNNEPRQSTWNKDDIIRCNRVASSDNESTFLLSSEEKTIFSVNKSLLLGSFICSKISVETNDGVHDLKSSLSVEVQILEAPCYFSFHFKDYVKTLICFKTSLRSSDTKVFLPKPILIRPGLFYKISLRGFPESYRHSLKELLTKVQIEHDINIEFHDDNDCDGQVVGLVSVLNFNRI